jgi:hypothetical protein
MLEQYAQEAYRDLGVAEYEMIKLITNIPNARNAPIEIEMEIKIKH